MLPNPLTPAGCNLRDFHFMPLDVQRLLRSRSWLVARRIPELGYYMMNLWIAAWHEIPAASLEDDDDVLADVARCEPNRWLQLREQALRGWVKCSDGRLYHPVVAEKALEAWHSKAHFAWKKECDRLRKANKQRAEQQMEPLPMPPEPVELTLDDMRQGSLIPPEESEIPAEEKKNPPEIGADSGGKTGSVSGESSEIALKGEGEGQGEVREKVNPLGGQTAPDRQGEVVRTIFAYWQKVMNSPRSVLDANRRGLIDKALKSYSAADICRAIRGCSKTPHNMGQNDRNTKFNGLDLILRNAEKIDYFIRLDERAATASRRDETVSERNTRVMAEVMGTVGEQGMVLEMGGTSANP